MKLTSFTDYSLRVLLFLAADPGRRVTVAEVAQAFSISENHLTKVVHLLGRQGWIETVRGKGGGMRLGGDPKDIVIGAVVRDTEGPAQPAECFLEDGGHCAITGSCRLQGVLGEAVQAFYEVLDRYTLADISRNKAALARLLFVNVA